LEKIELYEIMMTRSLPKQNWRVRIYFCGISLLICPAWVALKVSRPLSILEGIVAQSSIYIEKQTDII
jgi:hypothetical protein